MIEEEAGRVIERLGAGFPSFAWHDHVLALWLEFLRPVGLGEAMAAADGVIRTRHYLTYAAFEEQLAKVRARQLDAGRRSRWANQPELPESPLTATPEAKKRLAEIHQALEDQEWEDKAMLADRPFVKFNQEWFATHPDAFPRPPGQRGRRNRRRRK
jgi:hypothetical protein